MYQAEPPSEREPERARPRRSPARFLAPLALIAVVVVVAIVISSNTGSSASSNTANTGSPFSVTTAVPATALRPHRKRRATKVATTESNAPGLSAAGTGTVTTGTSTTGAVTTGTSTTAAGTYTIAAGDTFAAVSAKTGVPITRIEKLNPGVSSSALTVGQVIKLK